MKKEKYLNSVELKGDGEVFCRVSIVWPVWEEFLERLEKVKNAYPDILIGTGRNETRRAGNRRVDKWGCTWTYHLDYLEGQVVEHPLKDWERFKDYRVPDIKKETDWKKVEEQVKENKKKGILTTAAVEHGFFFLRLSYLRGFENFMLDIAEDNPDLLKLIELIERYWMEVIKKYVNIGVDIIHFGDDLGMQNSLPISPGKWRAYIKPCYKKLFTHIRKNGVHVYLHTDGYIVDIIPDLLECGVSVLNPQDLVNGIDNLEKLAKEKVFIDLDIDRQKITVFGRPEEIEEHILNCIKKLGSPSGGLGLIYGVYPGTPVENIEAVIHSMEKYRLYWRRK